MSESEQWSPKLHTDIDLHSMPEDAVKVMVIGPQHESKKLIFKYGEMTKTSDNEMATVKNTQPATAYTWTGKKLHEWSEKPVRYNLGLISLDSGPTDYQISSWISSPVHMTAGPDHILYVVDSTETDQENTSQWVFFKDLATQWWQGGSNQAPRSVLVLATNADHPEARKLDDIKKHFVDLMDGAPTNWEMAQSLGVGGFDSQSCSAKTGAGIKEAFRWLLDDDFREAEIKKANPDMSMMEGETY